GLNGNRLDTACWRRAARIVEQAIDAAPFCDTALDDFLNIGFLGDVRLDKNAAVPPKRRLQGLPQLQAASAGDKACAFTCEYLRGTAAYATGRPRYDDNFAVQSRHMPLHSG